MVEIVGSVVVDVVVVDALDGVDVSVDEVDDSDLPTNVVTGAVVVVEQAATTHTAVSAANRRKILIGTISPI